MIYELLGYAASVMVAISLMMSSILRLRVLNLIGASLFAAYGLAIGSMPVAVVNVFIVGVNVFYLARLFSARELFRILEVRPESEYLGYFLEETAADIRRYIPEFRQPPAHALVVFVLRDLVPAGLLVGEPRDDGSLLIHLDYVLPNYRDFKVGDFLFRRQASFFRERGIHRLVARASTSEHAGYLRRMGFDDRNVYGELCWVRDIEA
jgi:GNAT superfamily N-acetyltransferase